MVNIAGRSKGCTTCRKRKVKCDEGRPTCNRCKRCGFICDGPRETAFITQTKTKSVQETERRSISLLGEYSHDALETSDIKFNSHRPLSLSGFEDIMCLSYAWKHFSRGGPVHRAWDLSLRNRSSHSSKDLLQNALKSLALIFYGNHHRQSAISTRGYVLYGSVLHQLNSALSDPVQQLQDATMLTVVVLVLLEAFVPTGKKNYLKHIRGLEQLFDIRGPPMDKEGSLEIVRSLRLLLILGSLTTSTPSVFAQPEWKRLPWSKCSGYTFPNHQMIDVLADCSQLRYQRNELSSEHSPPGKPHNHHQDEVIASALCLIDELRAIRPTLNARFLSELGGADTSLHFPTNSSATGTLRVSKLSSSTSLMLYNTALIHVIDIITGLSPSPHHSALSHAAAVEISRCLEFNLSQSTFRGSEAMTVGHMAFTTAWKELGREHIQERQRLFLLMKMSVKGAFAKGLWEE